MNVENIWISQTARENGTIRGFIICKVQQTDLYVIPLYYFNSLVLNCQAQYHVILLINLVGSVPIQGPLSKAKHKT